MNQFGFRPGSIGDEFAEALIAKASDDVPVRVVVDRQGSDPDRGSRGFYERLLAAGVDVRVVRATQLRGPVQPVSAGGPTRWNFDRLGSIDHRKTVVVDGRVGWVGGAGIEDHFHDGRFHDLFLRVAGPVTAQLQLVFVATFGWLGGVIRSEELDDLFPEPEEPAGSAPATVLHNAPGGTRSITSAIAELLDGARESLDVVNPYVTDGRMIRRIADAARAVSECGSSSPQLPTTGLVRRRSITTTRPCSGQAFASSSTRRCSMRRRSSGTVKMSSSGRATSKRGASGASSRSTCSYARPGSRSSSTRASRLRRRSCRGRDVLSQVCARG